MKGITFGTIHSFRDLNLILSKSEITPAKPKTNYIEIPGSDIPVDLTMALGKVNFSQRECKFTFTMNPSGGLSEGDFERKKTEVSNALNGLACKITLDKDPDYYYTGRCSVDEYLSDKRVKQIVIKATVNPYKLKQEITTVIAGSGTYTLVNDRMSVIPTVTATVESTLIFKGSTFDISAGEHKFLDIQLSEGDNQITVDTTGTVTFKYQEGAL